MDGFQPARPISATRTAGTDTNKFAKMPMDAYAKAAKGTESGSLEAKAACT